MARLTKQGIEYFPVDVQFDDKIDLYLMEHGAHGLAILCVLWQFIYRDEGYFVVNSPDLHLRITYKLKIPIGEIERCIQACLSRGIFDLYLHDQYAILTSRGIQKRFFEITRKRKSVKAFPPFLLVDDGEYPAITYVERADVNVPANIQKAGTESVDSMPVNKDGTGIDSAEMTPQAAFPRNQSTCSGVNSGIGTQRKVKESKGKKSKEKTLVDPSDLVCAPFQDFWESYPTRNGKKLAKAEALAKFAKLTADDQVLCVQAARNFAASDLVRRGFGVKDPHRFILNGHGSAPWRDWIEPEVKTVTRQATTIDRLRESTINVLEGLTDD